MKAQHHLNIKWCQFHEIKYQNLHNYHLYAIYIIRVGENLLLLFITKTNNKNVIFPTASIYSFPLVFYAWETFFLFEKWQLNASSIPIECIHHYFMYLSSNQLDSPNQHCVVLITYHHNENRLVEDAAREVNGFRCFNIQTLSLLCERDKNMKWRTLDAGCRVCW